MKVTSHVLQVNEGVGLELCAETSVVAEVLRLGSIVEVKLTSLCTQTGDKSGYKRLEIIVIENGGERQTERRRELTRL